MKTSYLLQHLIFSSAVQKPDSSALKHDENLWSYQSLAELCQQFAAGLIQQQIPRQERISIFLEKRMEFVVAAFGSANAANIFVPINPILKKDQVHHILRDSGSQVLVTSMARLTGLLDSLSQLKDLKLIVVTDCDSQDRLDQSIAKSAPDLQIRKIVWKDFLSSAPKPPSFHPEFSLRSAVDTDAVGILYTSGSTGLPKGVVLSHRNMVFGAKNVASYLENNPNDRLLAVLPLSFDAGFSQLTTAFHSGAQSVLLNHLSARDVLDVAVQEKITGLTAVPPLWIQIAELDWPGSLTEHLRYFANTGGRMPAEVLKKLRAHFPKTKPYLMYGLTESFRSTYLPPDQVDRRPDSIGRAIPNAEILILKQDGSRCGPREPGELVHRGALVGLGYWKDPDKTAERYKILPPQAQVRPSEIVIPEICVFSGDVVEMDEEGYIYFIGRNDEMIKTSGYRVSPVEVEEIIYNSGWVKEVAVFAVAHPTLGQKIIASVLPLDDGKKSPQEVTQQLMEFCKVKMPVYMVPGEILARTEAHPRNQNGKLDRPLLRKQYLEVRPTEDAKS